MNSLLPAIIFLLASIQMNLVRADRLVVENLPDETMKEKVVGCSCAFNRLGVSPKNSLIAWELGPNLGPAPTAIAYVNGVLEELNLVSRKDEKKLAIWNFRNSTLNASIECIAVPNQTHAEPEGVALKGRLVMLRGKRGVTIPIEGSCGC